MVTDTRVTAPTATHDWSSDTSAIYAEGLLAGLLGALTIAAWFLLLDSLRGRPLYTPMVLGTMLFGDGASLADPTALPIDFERVASFTWIHLLAFLVLGVIAARLVAVAERDSNYGFGVVLLFVVFEFGIVVACMIFAEPVLSAIAWPSMLVGNLLAAAVMAGVFWRRHPQLRISP